MVTLHRQQNTKITPRTGDCFTVLSGKLFNMLLLAGQMVWGFGSGLDYLEQAVGSASHVMVVPKYSWKPVKWDTQSCFSSLTLTPRVSRRVLKLGRNNPHHFTAAAGADLGSSSYQEVPTAGKKEGTQSSVLGCRSQMSYAEAELMSEMGWQSPGQAGFGTAVCQGQVEKNCVQQNQPLHLLDVAAG